MWSSDLQLRELFALQVSTLEQTRICRALICPIFFRFGPREPQFSVDERFEFSESRRLQPIQIDFHFTSRVLDRDTRSEYSALQNLQHSNVLSLCYFNSNASVIESGYVNRRTCKKSVEVEQKWRRKQNLGVVRGRNGEAASPRARRSRRTQRAERSATCWMSEERLLCCCRCRSRSGTALVSVEARGRRRSPRSSSLAIVCHTQMLVASFDAHSTTTDELHLAPLWSRSKGLQE